MNKDLVEAIIDLIHFYEKAEKRDVKNPMAWSLYRTWEKWIGK